MEKQYWMWQGQGDKMIAWLTDDGVKKMWNKGYTIIPYDPNITPSNTACTQQGVGVARESNDPVTPCG